ncbi:hypothetical protein AU506_06860 [Lonsdalea populi]|nr:hypothetical protein AU495_11170 [Lonsdalea populi]RAT43453.1 hypothetical protein AU494_09015 [Lonsdalea populi]RAT76055.1 hypothetical protein AU506_06860 [Lonsdalea populi]
MAEAEDMVKPNFPDVARIIKQQIFDMLARDDVAGFPGHHFTVTQFHRQRQALLAGGFKIIVIITIDGLIFITH